MQIRKFEAANMSEALQLVKQELGPDAIILSTKNHRKGFGLMSRASVEVTAAISERNLSKKTITEKVLSPEDRDRVKGLSASQQGKIYNKFNDYYQGKAQEKNREKSSQGMGLKNSNVPNQALAKAPSERRYADIADDDQRELMDILRGGSREFAESGADVASSYQAPLRNPAPQAQAHTHMPQPAATQFTEQTTTVNNQVETLKDEVRRLKMIMEEFQMEQATHSDRRVVEQSSEEIQDQFESLIRNGMDRKYAAALIKTVSFQLTGNDHRNPDRILEVMASEVMNQIRLVDPLANIKEERGRKAGAKVISFVGPTGVGKTTTMAKIAAHALSKKNLRVGFINLDSYKVGASDQLQTYAKILNIPFRNATTEAEFDRALEELKPMDLILIDTAGRSQKDQENLAGTKLLLDSCEGVEKILVMNTATRDQDIYDILNRFRIFKPTSVIFSKLDESSVFGCIYNVALKSKLPLSYFTVGQRVPEDLELSTKERVVDLILELSGSSANA